jgi:hypothetical protein
MSNVPETRPEADVMELINGIIIDVQVLIRQQLALIQHEIKAEIERAVDAGSLVAAGLAIVVMGSGLLCVMLFICWRGWFPRSPCGDAMG